MVPGLASKLASLALAIRGEFRGGAVWSNNQERTPNFPVDQAVSRRFGEVEPPRTRSKLPYRPSSQSITVVRWGSVWSNHPKCTGTNLTSWKNGTGSRSSLALTVGHRSVTASESKTSQITISNSCALCEWLTRRYEPHPCCVPEDTMFFLQVWYIATRRRCKTSENCRRTQGHTHTHRRSGHTHTQHTPSTDGLRYARRVIQLPCTLLKHVPFSIGHFTNLMSYQIIRLTVLSTIKLCFPDSKLYLCMCRVIYFCQLLMWKAGHIRFYVRLSYQRIVWFYVYLLWILRPTVLSTIYQVMLVVIIQHIYLLWILRLTSSQTQSCLCMCCVIGCQLWQ